MRQESRRRHLAEGGQRADRGRTARGARAAPRTGAHTPTPGLALGTMARRRERGAGHEWQRPDSVKAIRHLAPQAHHLTEDVRWQRLVAHFRPHRRFCCLHLLLHTISPAILTWPPQASTEPRVDTAHTHTASAAGGDADAGADAGGPRNLGLANNMKMQARLFARIGCADLAEGTPQMHHGCYAHYGSASCAVRSAPCPHRRHAYALAAVSVPHACVWQRKEPQRALRYGIALALLWRPGQGAKGARPPARWGDAYLPCCAQLGPQRCRASWAARADTCVTQSVATGTHQPRAGSPREGV